MRLDPRTGLPLLQKTVYQNRVYAFEFGPFLGSNTISSINSVTATARGLVTEVAAMTVGATAIDGTLGTVRLSVGTDGEDYLVQMKITDSGGNNIDLYGIMQVRDPS